MLLPTTVVEFHRQVKLGEERPGVGHREGDKQGVTIAGLPPGQKLPGGQSVGVGVVDADGQPYPGIAAVQGPEQVALVTLVVDP